MVFTVPEGSGSCWVSGHWSPLSGAGAGGVARPLGGRGVFPGMDPFWFLPWTV